jgi:hypothetical protein
VDERIIEFLEFLRTGKHLPISSQGFLIDANSSKNTPLNDLLVEFSDVTRFNIQSDNDVNYVINRLLYYVYALYQADEFEMLLIEIKKIAHPNSVSNIKMDGESLSEDVVKGVTNYFAVIMIIFILGIFVVSLDPNILDLTTVITSVAACLNNIGPGLSDMIGPLGSFAELSYLSKTTLIIAMLIGRLEIYPILLVFNPKVWLGK